MLKGVHPLITADLLAVLAKLGHGDTVVVADRNFPSFSQGVPTISLAGATTTSALEAVWSLVPIDTFVDPAVSVMHQLDGALSPIHAEVADVASAAESRDVAVAPLERFAFYEAAKSAQLVIQTADDRPYGCVVFSVGIIPA